MANEEADNTVGDKASANENEEENCSSRVDEASESLPMQSPDITTVTQFSVECNEKVCRDGNELGRDDGHSSENERDMKPGTTT